MSIDLAELHALVQKWRELSWRNMQPWPDVSAGEYAHGKQSGICADELAATLRKIEQDSAATGAQGRNAEGYLCYAWGETDLPVALFGADRDDVQRFLVCEWFGDAMDPELPGVMDHFDQHDFRECPLEFKFEIGGIRIERAYGYATHDKPTAPAPRGVTLPGWEFTIVPDDPYPPYIRVRRPDGIGSVLADGDFLYPLVAALSASTGEQK